MRLVYKGKGNDKMKPEASFSVRLHGDNKKPSYGDATNKKREGTIDGKKTLFFCHPKKTGDRVNFNIDKEWNYVDDQSLWDAVNGKVELTFVTAQGRAAKAAPATATAPAATTTAAAK
jgi:hypothetical protein